MDNKIRELIDKLQAKIDKYQKEIDIIQQKSADALKNQPSNDQKISTDADKELKDLRIKLTICSQERDEVQKELDAKIKELENSSVSNEEKRTQINQLLVENKEELNMLNKSLLEAWAGYNTQRDKIVDRLLRPCTFCQYKTKMIEDSNKVRGWLFGAVFLLLILLLLSFFCGYCSPKKPNQKKKIIST